MKAFAVLGFLACMQTICAAQQSSIKLYAFKQAVVSGVKSSYETDEKGKEIKTKPQVLTNYLIYISHPIELELHFIELWIDGKHFGIKEQRTSTPVQISYDNGTNAPELITLINETTDNVLKLEPVQAPSFKTTISKKIIKANELILAYKLNGKIYLKTMKKIKSLRTAHIE